MNTEDYGEYIDLLREKKEIAARTKEINQRLEELEAAIVETMIDDEMQQVKIKGTTLYLQSHTYVKSIDEDKVRAYFERTQPEMLKVYQRSLQAYVKGELESATMDKGLDITQTEDLNEAIPEGLRGAVEVSFQTKVGYRGL